VYSYVYTRDLAQQIQLLNQRKLPNRAFCRKYATIQFHGRDLQPIFLQKLRRTQLKNCQTLIENVPFYAHIIVQRWSCLMWSYKKLLNCLSTQNNFWEDLGTAWTYCMPGCKYACIRNFVPRQNGVLHVSMKMVTNSWNA